MSADPALDGRVSRRVRRREPERISARKRRGGRRVRRPPRFHIRVVRRGCRGEATASLLSSIGTRGAATGDAAGRGSYRALWDLAFLIVC